VRGPRFDTAVVGSGPAGSVAALTLARAGASVALIDKAGFPRDKACGDLVGPRGVQLLTELGLESPDALRLGDMVVVGPTGGRALLPAVPGLAYPGEAWAVPRTSLDARLRRAALDAGAEEVTGRAGAISSGAPGPAVIALDQGGTVEADVVIGADGAASRVAESAGLVDHHRVLWGFAMRAYVEQPVELPYIAFWDPTPGRAFPGYGWIFPGADGRSNAGLGLGTGSDRRAGARATRQLDAFLDHLRALGLLGAASAAPKGGRLGGWLKMGMVGTIPARGNVLLVGDAAGLVNPLQGEGIAQAMDSGRAAATAVIDRPAEAASRYVAHLRRTHLPYQGATAGVHATLVSSPRMVSLVGRLLTTPTVARAVGGGWGVYWNDLLDGAAPGGARRVARVADGVARALTVAGANRRWLRTALRSGTPLDQPGPVALGSSTP
jgi:geranylgeranyl reductase family protein